jgi:hypothetical protein
LNLWKKKNLNLPKLIQARPIFYNLASVKLKV